MWMAIRFGLMFGLVGCTSPGVEDDVSETGEETDTDIATESFLNLSVTEFEANRLLWSITAESETPVRAYAEFHAEGVLLRTTSMGALGTSHDLSLVGLRSETDYEVTVYGAEEGGEVVLSSSTSFRTRSLPDGLSGQSVVQAQSDKIQPGYTSFGPAVTGMYGYMVDSAGEVVWYFEDSEVRDRQGARKIEELDNGHLLMLSGRGFRVVSPLGEVVTTYSGGTHAGIHHDAIVMPNGHVLALSNETRAIDVAGDGEMVDVLGDTVLEIDSDGQVVWSWSSFDHLDTTRFPSDLSNKQAKGNTGRDWTHANSLNYRASDDSILISLRSQHWVVKISRETGEVLWRLGEGGDFTLTEGSWFYAQHDAAWSDDTLTLYDNGNERPGPDVSYSRGVRYAIDEDGMTARLVQSFQTESYTPRFGSTQSLGNGNLLMCAGGILADEKAQIVESDEEGALVWQLTLDEPGVGVYRAYRLSPSWPYGGE